MEAPVSGHHRDFNRGFVKAIVSSAVRLRECPPAVMSKRREFKRGYVKAVVGRATSQTGEGNLALDLQPW